MSPLRIGGISVGKTTMHMSKNVLLSTSVRPIIVVVVGIVLLGGNDDKMSLTCLVLAVVVRWVW